MTVRVLDLTSCSFRAMGTDVHVLVLDGRDDDLVWAAAEVERCEARWSRFRPASDVSRLNAAAGQWVPVAAETSDLLQTAARAHVSTKGAFDPLLGVPLAALGYDRSFDQLRGGPAGVAHLDAPRPAVGGIELRPAAGLARIPAGTNLDLGGIAKGWTADRVAAALVARGADGACANLGGDLAVAGAAPDATGWIVEVERTDPAVPADLIGLRTGGLATSTTQRRTWTGPDGDPRHHLLDPRSGRPCESPLAEVTVVASSAALAEVLTKVAFVAPDGFDAALRAVGAVAVLTHHDGRVEERGAPALRPVRLPGGSDAR